MNYKMMGRLIALILIMEACFMLPALLICALDGDQHAAHAFLCGIGLTQAAAVVLLLGSHGAKAGFHAR